MPSRTSATIREFVATDYQAARQLWSSIEGIGLSESDTPEAINTFLNRNPGFSAVALNAEGQVMVPCYAVTMAAQVRFTTWLLHLHIEGVDSAGRLLTIASQHLQRLEYRGAIFLFTAPTIKATPSGSPMVGMTRRHGRFCKSVCRNNAVIERRLLL